MQKVQFPLSYEAVNEILYPIWIKQREPELEKKFLGKKTVPTIISIRFAWGKENPHPPQEENTLDVTIKKKSITVSGIKNGSRCLKTIVHRGKFDRSIIYQLKGFFPQNAVGIIFGYMGDVPRKAGIYAISKKLSSSKKIDLCYGDEDSFIGTAENRTFPLFKARWDERLAHQIPLLGRYFGVRSHLFSEVLGDVPMEKKDFFLHLSENAIRECKHPLHIPLILYSKPLNGPQLKQPKQIRTTPKLSHKPLVSIIVPTGCFKPTLLNKCISSVILKTSYKHIEVIIVDNSASSNVSKILKNQSSLITVIKSPGKFNYSKLINQGARRSKGKFLILLNDDVEVPSGQSDWIEILLEQCESPDIGAVGIKLLYPDKSVQHGGVVLGMFGLAFHLHQGLSGEDPGYMQLLNCTRQVSAVTAACLMTSRASFNGVGGFNEKNLPILFNDVDYCLKLRKQGLKIVYCGSRSLIHHESISIKMINAVTDQNEREAARYMRVHWPKEITSDPFFSPHLSLDSEHCTICL